jgi:hypothetical protein
VIRLAVDVVRLLQRAQLDLSSEKHLQECIASLLESVGIAFEREIRLSDRDIPDFLLAGGIAIECKMRNKARKVAVYKQLCRYAEHEAVKVLVLASNMSIGLPPEINGKPVYVASLSHGWL